MTDPNIYLEPELKVIAKPWDAQQRAKMAEKFANWSNQLSISAIMMKGDNDNLKVPPHFDLSRSLQNPSLN